MYCAASATLRRQGMEHYEVSSYAKPGHRCAYQPSKLGLVRLSTDQVPRHKSIWRYDSQRCVCGASRITSKANGNATHIFIQKSKVLSLDALRIESGRNRVCAICNNITHGGNTARLSLAHHMPQTRCTAHYSPNRN